MKLKFIRETILVVNLKNEEMGLNLIPFDGARLSLKNYKDIINPLSSDFSIVISSELFLDAWYYFNDKIKDKNLEESKYDSMILKSVYEEVVNNDISLIKFILSE